MRTTNLRNVNATRGCGGDEFSRNLSLKKNRKKTRNVPHLVSPLAAMATCLENRGCVQEVAGDAAAAAALSGGEEVQWR